MTDFAVGHVNPPKQKRSRRTLERLVNASLEILERDGPEGLTVHAVVDRAGSSVGSFYARFGGKDDLLEYIGDRVWREAIERWDRAVVGRNWSDLELSELVEGAIALLVDSRRSRSIYLRALDRMPGRRTDAYATFQAHVLDGISDLLLDRRDEMAHERPEVAVRLGLLAVQGVVASDAWQDLQDFDGTAVVRECRALLLGYLTGGASYGGASDVNFFDVWG